MQLLIDLATMAVMQPGGIPINDLALVRGDTIPLRVILLDEGTPVTPSGVRPALAIKTALASDSLVLAATNLEPVDDALGMAYVGSLSVNTTQLVEAMGSADRIDLVGEVVLIAGDGSQHTSSLIRVRVRQDIMPEDAVPPTDVITDWSELVASALAAQLPDALHDAGMYVTPTDGQTTLSTNMQITHRRDVTYYRLPLNHGNIVGHMAAMYHVDTVTLRGNVSTTAVCLEIYRLANGVYSLLGRSINAVTITNANQDVTWTMPAGISVAHDDTIIMRLSTAANADAVLTLGITQVAAANPESGADIVDGLIDPQRVINPDYPNIRHLLYVRLTVSYVSGVSIGGAELATKEHFDALSQDVVTTGQQVHQDAQIAREIAEGLTISTGSVTTGEPGSQAAITLTPGATPGSWIMGATIPQGRVGATGPQGNPGPVGPQGEPGKPASLDITDARYGQLAAANTWTQQQTCNGLVINQPDLGDAVSYANNMGRNAYGWSLGTDGKLRLSANIATATAMTIDNDWGAVTIDYLNVANASMTGPAVFDAGVTIGQTLWCNGVGTFTAGIGVGENITLYAPGNGIQAAVIQGIKKVENGVTTSGISLSSHGGVKFLEIVKDDQNKFVEIRKVGDDLSFNIYGVNNLNADNITTKKITFGPNDIFFYDNDPTVIECTAMWRPYGLDVRGPAIFSGGVTMGQTLNVSGLATLKRCAVHSAEYSLFSVLTGAAVWQNRTSGVFDLRGDDAYGMGVALNVGRSNGEPARIIKQPQKEALSHTDVPNLQEGDTRWVKFNTALTDAQYNQAATAGTLDATTLYVTTDGGKVYIGNHALN